MVTSLPHVRTGALRALGIAGSNRFEMLPAVPTIAETVPGYEARTWAGVGVPTGTPAEIIARLNINAGLANPTIKSRLADLGTIPKIFTSAEFGAYVAAESEKWAKVIQFAGSTNRGRASLTGAGQHQARAGDPASIRNCSNSPRNSSGAPSIPFDSTGTAA
jgi:tripartite-type tricarboxylate transporter receptor subunit TctC